MATHVDPRAAVDPRAEIAEDVFIGPFCVVGPNVRIGRGTRLESQVSLMGHTTLGEFNQLFPGVVIGAPPQDVSYGGSETEVEITTSFVKR